MPAIPSLQTGPPLPSSFKRKELEQLALRRIHAEFQFLPTLTEEHLLPLGNVRDCEEGAGREYMKHYVESFIDFKRYSEEEIGVIEEVSKTLILSDDILCRLGHKYAPGSTGEDVGRLFLWMPWLVDVKGLEVFIRVAEKVLHPLVSAVGSALLKYVEQLSRKNERQREFDLGLISTEANVLATGLINAFTRRALPTLNRRCKSPSPSPRRVRHPAHLPNSVRSPSAPSLRVSLSLLPLTGSVFVVKKDLLRLRRSARLSNILPVVPHGSQSKSTSTPAPVSRPIRRKTGNPGFQMFEESIGGSIVRNRKF
ncbi:hypothetical protein VKT23_001272 [Stygiomarasmius scandens]|uniref:Globin-sensor domain-containing protein n=1 Tax=Marasmiellus scandens TaxID=2682957 RepID=A0ABR1K6K9_9AGAR